MLTPNGEILGDCRETSYALRDATRAAPPAAAISAPSRMIIQASTPVLASFFGALLASAAGFASAAFAPAAGLEAAALPSAAGFPPCAAAPALSPAGAWLPLAAGAWLPLPSAGAAGFWVAAPAWEEVEEAEEPAMAARTPPITAAPMTSPATSEEPTPLLSVALPRPEPRALPSEELLLSALLMRFDPIFFSRAPKCGQLDK